MIAYMLLAAATLGATPCVSGPRVGQRPGPYSFVLCTGPERGKSHCYICQTGEKPAVIVFARTASEPLGKLAAKIDAALVAHKGANLCSWITILAEDQSKLDASLQAWSKKHALRGVPVGVFEDVEGPPSYRLHRDADVTVLLYVKEKVVANHAFRAGELTDARIAAIVADIKKIVPAKK